MAEQRVIGRNGNLTAYATDDPAVARVVDEAAGREREEQIDRLIKFGWLIQA